MISPFGATVEVERTKFQVRFLHAQTASLEGLNALPGSANYLIGSDPARWLRRIPTYARVRARNVYAGIDVIYNGTGGRLEYDFVIAPGADPSSIEMEFAGARHIRLDENGDILLDTLSGALRQKKAIIYSATQSVTLSNVGTISISDSIYYPAHAH